jgi:hypothetical protein
MASAEVDHRILGRRLARADVETDGLGRDPGVAGVEEIQRRVTFEGEAVEGERDPSLPSGEGWSTTWKWRCGASESPVLPRPARTWP